MQNCKLEMQSILRYVACTMYIARCTWDKISLNGTVVICTCQLMKGYLK